MTFKVVTLSAYEILCSMLMKLMEIEYAPAFTAREKQAKKYWYQVLIGERVPDDRPRKLTPRQHFLRKVIGSLLEIDRTNRLMRELEFYAAHAPRSRGPSKVQYLNYQIESHLHELYILRNRLDAFLTLLDRAYRNDRSTKRIGRAIRKVRRAVVRTLGAAVQIRSEHVHVKRLRVPDIERVEFIEEMSRYAPRELQPQFKRQLDSAYRDTRRRRLANMRQINDACAQLLDFMAANVMAIFLRRNLTVFTFPPGM